MWYRARLKKCFSEEEAWQLLESKGSVPLYSLETNSIIEIFFEHHGPFEKEILPFDLIEEIAPPSIDWTKEWERHSPHMTSKGVIVPLDCYGGSEDLQVLMKPGAGFGDLSHPTTKLILEMLLKEVKDKVVVDIGCGSGILALAAAISGAENVFAIDISEEALAHTNENSAYNHLENKIRALTPGEFLQIDIPPQVIAMNMIFNEQKEALKCLEGKSLHHSLLITSGILEGEEEKVLTYYASLGWNLIEKSENSGWLSFKMNRSPKGKIL